MKSRLGYFVPVFPKRNFLKALLIALLLLPPIDSVTCRADDLVSVYQQALAHDPKLQIAIYEKKAKDEVKWQAWSRLLPVLSGTYDFKRSRQKIISSDNTVYGKGETTFNTKDYFLTLNQPLIRYDAWLGVSQAGNETRRTEMELEIARQELMIRVATLYVKLLIAQDQLDLSKAEEEADVAHFDLAQGRFDMGLAPVTDLHDAKARLSAVKAKRVESENLYDDALHALKEVTSVLPEKIAGLMDDFTLLHPDPADPAFWVEEATRKNLNVALQREIVEVSRKEVRKQRGGHYPTLDLYGYYDNKNTEGTLFGGGSQVENIEGGLRLTVPLTQGGYVLSRTDEAKSLYSRALEELQRQLRAADRQARSSFFGIESTIQRVAALKEAVISQELALEGKKEGYRSGLYTSLAVLDAQRDLSQARQEYIRARCEYILNCLNLKQAVGTLSGDDLLYVNAWLEADPTRTNEATVVGDSVGVVPTEVPSTKVVEPAEQAVEPPFPSFSE